MQFKGQLACVGPMEIGERGPRTKVKPVLAGKAG
jgi:hypothetical protein